VAALRQNAGPHADSHRLADWAALADIIGNTIGMGTEVQRILSGVDQAQQDFATEEDLCVSVLGEWLKRPGNTGRWVEAKELNTKLSNLSSWRCAAWPYASGRALAQHLSAIWPVLERRFGAQRAGGQGGVYRYAFAHAEPELAERKMDSTAT